MIVHPVGAGDASIYIDAPMFRVEFWERPLPDFGWNLDAWEIEGCRSVREVLSWIEAHARGRIYTLYAVLTPPGKIDYLTYVLLDGTDPTRVQGDNGIENRL